MSSHLRVMSEKRKISAILKEAESSVTMDHIMEKNKNTNTLRGSIRSTVEISLIRVTQRKCEEKESGNRDLGTKSL